MDQLRPTPAGRHASPGTFIHKDLRDSTRVPAEGHHTPRPGATVEVPAQSNCPHWQNAYNCARPAVNVSADLVQPAYVLEGTRHDTGMPTSPAQQRSSETCQDDSASTDVSLRTHCTLPSSVRHLSSLPRGGVMWGYPRCSSPSSVQFSARQHSKTHTHTHSLSILLSRYPVSTHSSKPSAVSHHGTSTSRLHSTCHAYRICQLINGRAGQTARNQYKKGHSCNRNSFNAYTRKKAHQQGPAAPSSRGTSQLPHQELVCGHIKIN